LSFDLLLLKYQHLKTNLNQIKTIARITLDAGIKQLIFNRPVIFHHVPKCGGTSVRKVLGHWFIMVNDYRPKENEEEYVNNRINVKKLKGYNCLVGHYGTDKTNLYVRYSEVFTENRYKIFTFVREPLSLRISLYYYEKRHNIISNKASLADELIKRPNYLASIFGCTSDNYKYILNKYTFIGLFEELNQSLIKLAKLLNRKQVNLPHENLSIKDNQVNLIDNKFLDNFKTLNWLDYKIYNYCKELYYTKNQYE